MGTVGDECLLLRNWFTREDSSSLRPPGRSHQRKYAINATGQAAELHPLISAAGPMKLIAEYG